MSARSVVTLLALPAIAAGAGGCTRVIDAVTLEDCATDPTATGCGPSPWPTTSHGANSDPWLVSHRTVITEMRPRVLVLNFQNGVSADSARATAKRQVAAIAEGSRYHGYSDPSAPPFLRYEIAKVVDLTDATPASGLAQPVEHAAAHRADGRVRRARAVLVAVRRALRVSRSEGVDARRCRCASCSNRASSTRSGSRTARRACAARRSASSASRATTAPRPPSAAASRPTPAAAASSTTSSAASPSASRTWTPRAGRAAISRCAAGRSKRCGRRCRRCAPTRSRS